MTLLQVIDIQAIDNGETMRKDFLMITLLLFCLSKTAMGQNLNTREIAVYTDDGAYRIIDPNTTQVVAALPKSSFRFKIEVMADQTQSALGYDVTVFYDFYEMRRNQNLQPSDSKLNDQHNRSFGPSRWMDHPGISLNLNYIVGQKSKTPIRWFYGWKTKHTLYTAMPQTAYLTHDPNRSAACATAVNNSLADASLSWDSIKANCSSIIYFTDMFLYEKEYGVDWFITERWVLHARYNAPFDYSSGGYKIQQESKWTFGLGGEL